MAARWPPSRCNCPLCSDGFVVRCDNGESARVTFSFVCFDHEEMSRGTTTAGHSGDLVRDVMLGAVENRFGDALHTSVEIECLCANGSGYAVDDRRMFAVKIRPTQLITLVYSLKSNRVSACLVKMMSRDCVEFMLELDTATALRQLRHRVRTLQRETSPWRSEIFLDSRV